jgi:hypothetical protein
MLGYLHYPPDFLLTTNSHYDLNGFIGVKSTSKSRGSLALAMKFTFRVSENHFFTYFSFSDESFSWKLNVSYLFVVVMAGRTRHSCVFRGIRHFVETCWTFKMSADSVCPFSGYFHCMLLFMASVIVHEYYLISRGMN